MRPIHVDDLARLCVELARRTETIALDAVGPRALTFRPLVDAIRTAVGRHALIVPVPGVVLTALSRAVSLALRDTLLTRDEYHAMTDGLADSDAPTTGTIMLTDWIAEHAPDLGRRYANELDRHYRPATSHNPWAISRRIACACPGGFRVAAPWRREHSDVAGLWGWASLIAGW